MDKGFPEQTVNGFLNWIRDVKAGNNFYELSKRLEKSPNDRELLVKIVGKLDGGERDVIFDYLRRAIKINPDFNDELSQEAYEKLAYFLMGGIPFEEGKEKEEYLARWQEMFQGIVGAYYPDKFKHELKGNFGLSYIFNWFYQSRQFEKVLSYFNDFLKRRGDNLDLAADMPVISIAVPSLVSLGMIDDADRWIARIRDFSKHNENLKLDQNFIHFYSRNFIQIIDSYGRQGRRAEAEKYAGIFSEEMTRLGQGMYAEMLMERFAALYGVLAEATLKNIEEKLKTASGMPVVRSTTARAAIFAKMGKKEEAKKSLLTLYKNEDFFRGLSELEVPEALNLIAWSMVELKIVDQTSLEIAQRAVALRPVSASKDTLACVYAELENFKAAVKIEKEALAEEKDEAARQDYEARIRIWQKKIK